MHGICLPSHLCAVVVKARAQTTDFTAFELVFLKSSVESQGSKGFTRCTFHWIICQHLVPIVPICRCLITHNVGRNEGAKVHQWGKLASEFYELSGQSAKHAKHTKHGAILNVVKSCQVIQLFEKSSSSSLRIGRKQRTIKRLPDSVDQAAFRGDMEGISCKDLAKIQVAQSSAGTTIR